MVHGLCWGHGILINMVKVKIKADSRYPVDRKQIIEIIKKVLDLHKLDDVEVSVLVVGKRKMAELNQQFRGKQGPTDVLSFALNEVPTPFGNGDQTNYLGDIVVCYPIAVDYALKRQILVDRVINELVEHGCLHLLGVHHR